ncbi:MAG: hypothetical protein IPH13_05600 [Planctomycetes bacterium]|nr:hypothetical protein [Planctomycetota bacterium]MCC7170620.1 hypothetical protein [Planctomycetota bacterium]
MFSLPRVLVPLVLSLVWIGAESHAAVTTKKSNAKLTVKGDDANDAIILGGSGALGDVQVMVDGLLVAEFTGIRDIDVRTEGGDDEVGIHGVKIGGSLHVLTGTGVDDVEIRNRDRLLTDDACVFVGRDLDVKLGGQDGDEFECELSSAQFPAIVGRTLSIRGATSINVDGIGQSFDAESGDLLIGSDLKIRSDTPKATTASLHVLRIDDVAVGGNSQWILSNAVDEVLVREPAFVGKVVAKLGGGDDSFIVPDAPHASAFSSSVNLSGGAGVADFVQLGDGPYASPPAVEQFELEQ